MDPRESLRRLANAQRLVGAGQFASLVDYLRALPFGVLEDSPTLALLLGIGHARLGRQDEGHRWAIIALARARQNGDRSVEARACNVCGAIAMETGRVERATGHFVRGRTLAERTGDYATVGRCSANLGIIENMRGEYDLAIGSYHLALGAYHRARLARGAVEVQHNLTITYREKGDHELALATADRAVHDAAALGDDALKAQTLAGRAEVRVALRQADVARPEVQTAIKRHRELGDVVGEAEDLRILGLALAALGELTEAEAAFRQAMPLARDHNRPLLGAAAGRDLAHLVSVSGRGMEAIGLALEARARFVTVGAGVEVKKLDALVERLRSPE